MFFVGGSLVSLLCFACGKLVGCFYGCMVCCSSFVVVAVRCNSVAVICCLFVVAVGCVSFGVCVFFECACLLS